MSDEVKQWQRAIGVAADGAFGPRTLAASLAILPEARDELPWITEARAVIGLHELRDNAALVAWLKSDGKRLGDPAKLPWCGDFVETAIKRGLPDEPFPGTLGQNPYWARNWISFGRRSDLTYGAVVVFERGPQSGHVGFAVGQDGDRLMVLGGNQGNAVSVVPIARSRLLACRWPLLFPARPIHLPRMTSAQATSFNEA